MEAYILLTYNLNSISKLGSLRIATCFATASVYKTTNTYHKCDVTYIDVLDTPEAFDRVWHVGLFNKLPPFGSKLWS